MVNLFPVILPSPLACNPSPPLYTHVGFAKTDQKDFEDHFLADHQILWRKLHSRPVANNHCEYFYSGPLKCPPVSLLALANVVFRSLFPQTWGPYTNVPRTPWFPGRSLFVKLVRVTCSDQLRSLVV